VHTSHTAHSTQHTQCTLRTQHTAHSAHFAHSTQHTQCTLRTQHTSHTAHSTQHTQCTPQTQRTPFHCHTSQSALPLFTRHNPISRVFHPLTVRHITTQTREALRLHPGPRRRRPVAPQAARRHRDAPLCARVAECRCVMDPPREPHAGVVAPPRAESQGGRVGGRSR
jgi:hypothetical protein